MDRTFTVRIGQAVYAVRATVDSADRTTNTPQTAVISSVTRDGAEIADAEFEPIASQIEDAVIEQHNERVVLMAGGAL